MIKVSEASCFFEWVLESTDKVLRGQCGDIDIRPYIHLLRKTPFGKDYSLSGLVDAVKQSIQDRSGEDTDKHVYCTRHNVLKPYNKTGKLVVDYDHLDGIASLTRDYARKNGEEVSLRECSLRFSQASFDLVTLTQTLLLADKLAKKRKLSRN